MSDAGAKAGTKAMYQRSNPGLLTICAASPRVCESCKMPASEAGAQTREHARVSMRLEAVHGDASKPKQDAGTGSRDVSESLLSLQPTLSLAKAIAPSTQGKRDTAEQASLSYRQPPAS